MGSVALTTLGLRSEPDLVTLRRCTRSAGEEFGLDDRRVRGLSAAVYEIGSVVLSLACTADAELRVIDGPAVQVVILAGERQPEALRGALSLSVERIRTLVDKVSLSDETDNVAVSLAAALPQAGAARLRPLAGASDPVTKPSGSAAGLQEENAALRRLVAELHLELQETNRGVVALYAELDDQAGQLRHADQRLRETLEVLRRRADELDAANRAKEDFLATLSHELRTPLNAMLGWSRLLRMGKLEGPAVSRALETIERNAHAQEQLIGDILDISRIVTGKLRVELRPVQLEPIIDASLDAVRPAAEAKGLALTCALTSAGTVLGDPDRLQQVFWNLLSNAIKFTPSGGHVSVALARAGQGITVTVTDTGEGIPPDLLPYVFDRFTQGDGTLTRLHGGLGLGLSIVRHIVELHGGHVEARSEGLATGATFSVTLPVSAIQPPT